MDDFPQKRYRRKRVSVAALGALLILLFWPGLAVLHLAESVRLEIILGYLLLISFITFILYYSDKRKAEAGTWRTPESTLHLAELFGGWAAAFVAQRIFRHKSSKVEYQTTFWFIILGHQLAAYDYFHDWANLKRALEFLAAKT